MALLSTSREPVLRPETPSDAAFLVRLFASTRSVELAFLGGTQGESGGLSPAQETFLRIQLQAQSRGFEAAYPHATRSIVLVRGGPAGRWIVDHAGAAITLVDVALLPEHRGRGVGTALLTRLQTEAKAAGRRVRLHVTRENPARRLYERFGFVRTGGDAVRDCMELPPSPG